MGRSANGGSSVGAHYAAVARATGKVITAPELPAALRYLWNIFAMLHRCRGGNGFGPNPIAWSEVLAYCQLTRLSLTAWELEAIRLLDDAYLSASAEQQPQDD